MRKKFKEYDLKPVIKKLPEEILNSKDLYHFRGAGNDRATLVLTRQGYEAIMKKDGKHFTDIWLFESIVEFTA